VDSFTLGTLSEYFVAFHN